ncbi:5-formyltetrahydrofolate cyclo-ligase [Alteromonas sp. CYL-A6]|uniref:5-formyltetrahydrofolate cyclo-ligase n=1 Tax=Alteromonas nitratireducens TaxID=3390813 RepID=UPI0034C39DF8
MTTTTASSQSQRQQLRRELRAARRALSDAQQDMAAADIASQLLSLPAVADASVVAGYLPNDGEVDLTPLFTRFFSSPDAPAVALPVLHPFTPGHLLFLHYHPQTPMQTNRFGIAEPVCDVTRVIPPTAIDVVLLPLVGFDAHGNRLGMGGGFYDRTLAHRDRWAKKPVLIGIAHDCQQVPALPVQSWDVPLDIIVTPEQKIYSRPPQS